MMADMERASEVNKQFQDWLSVAHNGAKPIDTNVYIRKSFPLLTFHYRFECYVKHIGQALRI